MHRTIWRSTTHNARIALNEFFINRENATSKKPFTCYLNGEAKIKFESLESARAWFAKKGIQQ